MTTPTEALKLAIDTLEEAAGYTDCESSSPSLTREIHRAIYIGRAALAQPQPSAPLPVTMSGVAQYKARDLVARGYTIVGYTMTKPGDRTAVLIDAAVRWLTPEQQHTLMFVESSDVVAQPSAPSVEPAAVTPAAPAEWRKAVQEAYGWLWHINTEPMAPIPMWSPEKAAYQARKSLRELLTSAERGEAINAIAAHMDKMAGAAPLMANGLTPQAAPPAVLDRSDIASAQPAPQAAPTVPAAWIDDVMEQAQVFASAWSLVGGRFDNGNGLAEAEDAKTELRAMLAAAPQEPQR